MVWWGLKKPGLERIGRNVVTMKKRCTELDVIAKQLPWAMKERDKIYGGEIGNITCSVIEAARQLFFKLSRNRLQPSFGVKECSAFAGS